MGRMGQTRLLSDPRAQDPPPTEVGTEPRVWGGGQTGEGHQKATPIWKKTIHHFGHNVVNLTVTELYQLSTRKNLLPKEGQKRPFRHCPHPRKLFGQWLEIKCTAGGGIICQEEGEYPAKCVGSQPKNGNGNFF